MRAIIKQPGKDPEISNIGDKLEDLQEAVGGYLEHYGFGHGIGMLFDEEGRYKRSCCGRQANEPPIQLHF